MKNSQQNVASNERLNLSTEKWVNLIEMMDNDIVGDNNDNDSSFQSVRF